MIKNDKRVPKNYLRFFDEFKNLIKLDNDFFEKVIL